MYIHPIDYVTSDDSLPIDKFGSTNMVIADIQWVENGLCFVLAFCVGYFCIISRTGCLINILNPENSCQSFYSLERYQFTQCKSISIHGLTLTLHSETMSVTIELENLPNDSTFIDINNARGKANTFIILQLMKPTLSLDEELIKVFSDIVEGSSAVVSSQNHIFLFIFKNICLSVTQLQSNRK